MPIIYRLAKGSPLTHAELDGNFQFLTGSINNISGSYATTSSNTFIGDQVIQGNLSVFGTASFTYTTSSITTISASTFAVSISSPVIRYGFYEVLDSGASLSTSSLAWDSANKYWVYRNVTGSATSSAILLTGPVSTGGLGTEVAIPQYRIPMSNGNQSLVSSNIYTSGSLNIITGSTRILPFVESPIPTLGTGSGGFFLGGDNGAYGLYMGVSSSGVTWIQSNRNDGLADAYNISIQPLTGNVNIGKINTLNLGPKLDISGSTVITGSLNVTQGITSSLLGTSSYASFALTASHATNVPATASYTLQALSASFANNSTSASFATNSVSASLATNSISASFATNSTSASFAISASQAVSASRAISSSFSSNSLLLNNMASSVFATTGSNTFRGTQNITGSVNITGSLVVSGSSTLVNIGLAEMTGSLLMNTLDGRRLFRASSSLSSSISSSNELTTASFNGVISLNSNSGGNVWDSNFNIYYSGISGSNETQVSPVYTASFDGNGYNNFSIVVNSRPQIILSPSGSIQSYKVYIYNSGSTGTGWYVQSGLSGDTLQNGIDILLSGHTNNSFGNDLINAGFISGVSDPTGNTNTVTYVSQSLLTFTSSLVEINAPTITMTGSIIVSGSKTLTGTINSNGTFAQTGSFIVSGSATFNNTTFTVTGSQFFTGSSVSVGNQTITGSLSLTSNGIGTGLYINGQKQFNYISLLHTASILPTQNVSGSFIYSTTGSSSGISLVSGSRITFANTGIYNIQFSAQVFTATGATVDIWFKRNGTNIAFSGTKIGPTSNNQYVVAAWNFVDTFTSGSYVEIAYQTDQTNTQFQYIAATGNVPAIPSIIATVTQVA